LPVSRGADKNLQIVATGVESCREYYVKPLKEQLVHWTRVQKQACFSQKKAGTYSLDLVTASAAVSTQDLFLREVSTQDWS
jgi:hypothetical protein